MKTIALEFVPPNLEDGTERAVEEAQKVQDLSHEFGIEGRIRHLMIPGMIEEDPDRPVTMKPKMDPLDVWTAVRETVPGMKGICTQVTAFTPENELAERIDHLQRRGAGRFGRRFVELERVLRGGSGAGPGEKNEAEQERSHDPSCSPGYSRSGRESDRPHFSFS